VGVLRLALADHCLWPQEWRVCFYHLTRFSPREDGPLARPSSAASAPYPSGSSGGETAKTM
jgi:hypothetical protein